MIRFAAPCARARPLLVKLSALALALTWLPSVAAETTVVRVEEDWEMVVTNPDTTTDAPQATFVISPVSDLSSLHAAFEVNQQTLPSYSPGGLQLQLWDGDRPIEQRKFPNSAALATPGETVSWTQTMHLAGGNLIFEITSGSSTTWGTFGGQGYLKIICDTSLANLNSYSPDVSLANSGIGFAANRVQSVVLKAVRLITSDGQILEDTTPRVLYAQE